MEIYDRQPLWSNTLRQLRQDTGITQLELSKRSGVCQCHISYIENDRREPTARTLEKLLSSMGHTLEVVANENSNQL